MNPAYACSTGLVREQLERILASPEFRATEKLRSFLRFVVEEKLAGRSNRIKGYSIGVEVFERDEGFDPTSDPVVRVQARRLRAELERYYLTAGLLDRILIEVPKGGYVPDFLDRSTSSSASTRVAPAREVQPNQAMSRRIAIVPLEDLALESERTSLAIGLSEELITELTRYQDLEVVPCRPSWRPADAPRDPIELARSVGARFLLGGAIRRDGESIKVSARLSDTVDRRQIWADSFKHSAAVGELISTQEQIARAVLGRVAGEFGIISQHLSKESRTKPPVELATYEAMLRYYSHQIDPNLQSAPECFAALQAATQREPEYGPAWSALATLHCQMFSFDVPGQERPLERAIEYARKGVSLDSGSQLAHLISAYARHLADDADGFREESRVTLDLNPNSQYAVGTIGYFHAMRGEFDKALPLIDRAVTMSPCHPSWFHAAYVMHDLATGDDESALTRTRKRSPFLEFWDDVALAAILGRLARPEEAAEHLGRVRKQKPHFDSRARELIERSLKSPALVERLLEGLRSAGMRSERSGS